VTDPLGPVAIEAADLGWTYAGRSLPALQGLTFRVEPGRVLLVLGPSGSGKSTLARALAGLVPHTLPGRWQGRLRVGGMDVATTPARFLGERVGLVFQDPDSQLVMARVDDEVAFGLENRGWPRSSMAARVPDALSRVGLAGFERRDSATLSGGEKQRLAIADILAAGPSLLVFDEPTANLDPPGMHSTLAELAQLARRREHTIVLVEHRLEAALPLADDVLLIGEDGRQLAFAPAGSVGPDAVDLLARSGAWVPQAWQREGGPFPPAVRHRTAGSAAQVLQASKLRVAYPADGAGTRLALDGVSLQVRAGERVALVGPNGAGKSSLLFALAGLRRLDAGTVRLRTGPRSGELAKVWRDPARLPSGEIADQVGIIFQDPELGFVARTARAEVLAGRTAARRRRPGRDRPGGHAAPDPNAVLLRFGLGTMASEDPFRMSQGEQRRLSLAAVALRPPAVLLLDEPTFGLDQRGTDAVLSLLDELRAAGGAQLLATHDPRLLPACDRVVALDLGRMIFDGTPEAFLAAPPFSPAEPWRGTSSGLGPAGMESSRGSHR
jgi:energy-coupling factor transport system ATP-binding protein